MPEIGITHAGWRRAGALQPVDCYRRSNPRCPPALRLDHTSAVTASRFWLRCVRGAAKVLPYRIAAGQQHHTQAALQQQATEARGRSGGARLARDRQQRARGPRIKPGVNFRRAGLADDNMDVSILGDLKLHGP